MLVFLNNIVVIPSVRDTFNVLTCWSKWTYVSLSTHLSELHPGRRSTGIIRGSLCKKVLILYKQGDFLDIKKLSSSMILSMLHAREKRL